MMSCSLCFSTVATSSMCLSVSFCNSFLDTEALFPVFGLPQRLDAQGQPIPD